MLSYEGHIIGFGLEIRKLSGKQFCSLFLNCSPAYQTFGVVLQGNCSPMHVDTGLQSLGLNREAPAECDTGARNLKPIEYHEPMRVKEKAIPFLITSSRKPEKVVRPHPSLLNTN